jgi:DNA-binding PadR family transcriptional regulator
VRILKIGHEGDYTSSSPSGLAAATCILKCLYKGYTKDQIINGKFNGDEGLVSVWLDFLRDKHWVEEEEEEEDAVVVASNTNFKVTKKGKTWLKRLESASIKVDKQ